MVVSTLLLRFQLGMQSRLQSRASPQAGQGLSAVQAASAVHSAPSASSTQTHHHSTTTLHVRWVLLSLYQINTARVTSSGAPHASPAPPHTIALTQPRQSTGPAGQLQHALNQCVRMSPHWAGLGGGPTCKRVSAVQQRSGSRAASPPSLPHPSEKLSRSTRSCSQKYASAQPPEG